MNNTIRGIPLHTLRKSGFFPEITELAESWCIQKTSENGTVFTTGSVINSSKRLPACIAWLSLGTLFGLFLLASQSPILLLTILGMVILMVTVALIFTIVVFLAITTVSGSCVFFTRDVRQLDKCLKAIGDKYTGLMALRGKPIKSTLEWFAVRVAKMTLHAEDTDKTSDDARKWSELSRNFHATCKKFRYDLGPANPFFAKARVELDTEEEERKKALEAYEKKRTSMSCPKD